MKTSSLAASRGSRIGLGTPQKLIPSRLLLFDLCGNFCKVPFSRPVFIWLWAHDDKSCVPSIFVRNSDNCLMWQWSEEALPVRLARDWPKRLKKEKLGYGMSYRTLNTSVFLGFWKVTGCVSGEEWPKMALVPHLLYALRLCTHRKWKSRVLNCLPKYWKYAPYTKLLDKSRDSFRHLNKSLQYIKHVADL